MPRRRKTQTGADAQDIWSVPGRRYGEGVELQALQQSAPAPQVPQPGAGAPTPTAASPAPVAAPAPVDVGALLSAAPLGLLSTGTQRPDEPVTAGLSTGPGPGPGMLSTTVSTPLGRTLRMLAERTGDRVFQELLDRARL